MIKKGSKNVIICTILDTSKSYIQEALITQKRLSLGVKKQNHRNYKVHVCVCARAQSYKKKFSEDYALDEDFFNSRMYRDRLSIMAEVLDIARERALKTQIMYKANLNFAQLNQYLSLLLDLNLLKAVKASKNTFYKTTDEGLRYLQNYKEIRELLKKRKGNGIKEANSLYLVKRGTRVIEL